MEAFNRNDGLFGENFMVFGENNLEVFSRRGTSEGGREECGAGAEQICIGLTEEINCLLKVGCGALKFKEDSGFGDGGSVIIVFFF